MSEEILNNHSSNHPDRRYLLDPVYSNGTAKYFEDQAKRQVICAKPNFYYELLRLCK